MKKKTTPAPGSRFLYRLGCGLAVVLFLLVIGAPLVDNDEEHPDGAGQVVALFARDTTLRRTSLASAVGLAVTATVFFRPTPAPARGAAPKTTPRQPPTKIVGA